MPTLFEKLRSVREAKGIPLEDVASATRIQTKILRALEAGDVGNIPQVYVRAFLRAYAKEVGVNETQVLQQYEAYCHDSTPQKTEGARPCDHEDGPENPRGIKQVWRTISSGSQNVMTLLIGGVLIISLIISLSIFNDDSRVGEIQEVPITVQRPTESTADTVQTSSVPGSVQRLVEPSPPLVLRAMTFDSVWIRVVIDGKLNREYQAPPRWSMQWKAQEQFLISLDNAGAATFVLNNVSLGMIGEEGKPVVNYLIRRPGASPQQSPPLQQ